MTERWLPTPTRLTIFLAGKLAVRDRRWWRRLSWIDRLPEASEIIAEWTALDTAPDHPETGLAHGTYVPLSELNFDDDLGDGLSWGEDPGTYEALRDHSTRCVCVHSPEGHALSGCTVAGCPCRSRTSTNRSVPPPFPGFAGVDS